MGTTIKNLATKDLPSKTIFNNRFVVELCEKFHIHYRNLRIMLSMDDFIELCNGCVSALDRWNKRGNPEPNTSHIELCRKKVALNPHNDGIKINLNKNMYNYNKDKIFAEGNEFEDNEYIHLKIRDLRIEMSKKEFNELSKAVTEANKEMESSCISSSV